MNKRAYMQTLPTLEERLWDYIDGLGSPAERKTLEALLSADASARAQYTELLGVHEALGAAGLEEPSMRFTKNVMEAVAQQSIAPATTTYINKRVIRVIAAFFLTAIAAVLGYTLFLGVSTDTNGNVHTTANPVSTSVAALSAHVPSVHVPSVTLPTLYLDPYLSVFMLVAIVCGFVVLDSYLHRRKVRQSKAL